MSTLTDFHIHVQPWEQMHAGPHATLTDRLGPEVQQCMSDPAALLKLMDSDEIDRAVLINYVAPEVMGFTPAVNGWILDYCRASPQRLIPCGGVDVFRDPAPAETVLRLAERGMRVLKVHPPHSLLHADAYRRGEEGAWEGFAPQARRAAAKGMAELYAAAQEAGVIVMVHTGTSVFPGARTRFANPLDCDDVAIDFPELRLVLAHAGRPFWCEEAMFLARRHPNLYLDLSGIPPKRLLHYLPDLERLHRKCIWGTDWPAMGVRGMGANRDQFLELELDQEAQNSILRDNAAKLLDSTA